MPKKSEAINRKRKIDETYAAYEDVDFDSLDSSRDCHVDETVGNIRASTPIIDHPDGNIVLDDMAPGSVNVDSDSVDDLDFVGGLENVECGDSSGSEESIDDIQDNEIQAETNDHVQYLWHRILTNESCRLCLPDFNALLAASQIRHSIPDTAMNFFCKLFSSCLPSGNCAPKSFIDVVKHLIPPELAMDQTISYVCGDKGCNHRLDKLFGMCKNSNCGLFDQRQHACSCLRLRIRPQIESIVTTYYADIIRFLSSSVRVPGSNDVADIPSTPAYAAFGDNPVGDTLFISLIISSDGAQAFKSSRSTFWPCVAIIAELPPKVRVSVENVIALGFWVGRGEKTKPQWSLFLDPIISELESLKSGFDVIIGGKKIRVIVRILATIFDLPALASIWSVKQFNGTFGCMQCRHPGIRQGRTCLWPLIDPPAVVKTAEFYEEAWNYLRKAPPGSDYFGVKQISPLSRICNPAQVNIFDSMHLIYHGNARLIFSRLFASNTGKWTALFGEKLISELDVIVRNVRFPHHFNRKIPSLNSILSFKASELKNLLMYVIVPISAPFMDGIPNYWHWVSIYVHVVRLLSKPLVQDKDIDDAEKLIKIWKQLLPEMCHESSQNFNSHAVEHLPEQVKRFGPLWSISTFAFEGFNGHFSRYIQSSKGALDQLGRRFALHRESHKHLAVQVRQGRPFAETVKLLFPQLYQRWAPKTEESRYQLLNEIQTFFNVEAITWLQNRFLAIELGQFRFGKRATNGSEVFHSIAFSKKTASIIKYSDPSSDIGENYGEVVICFTYRDDLFLLMNKFKILLPTNVLQVSEPDNELLYSLYDDRVYGSFFYIVEKTSDFECVLISDVMCSAILIETDDSLTVTDVLPFEHD